MTINPLITQYIDILEKDDMKKTTKSHILQYLKWRNVLVEELIENGLKEQEYFDNYLTDKTIRLLEKSRVTRILVLKKFLRFHSIPFKKFENYKTNWFFEDDPVMKKFLILTGNTQGTKKNVNRFLNYYCVFRNKNPSELVDEAKTLTNLDLKVILKQFYDHLTIKTKKNAVSSVRKFYKEMADIHIDLPASIKPQKRRKMFMNKKLVDKEIVKQMLEGSDLRDSMLILACFESGLNPVDLVSLNVGDLKEHLNIENPEAINKVAVIVHIRQKNNVEFLCCFGKQTLRFMSKWLNYIQTILQKWSIPITDDFPIFTMKKAPYDRLKAFNVSANLKKICRKVGLDKKYTTADFRNSFNTRAKKMLKHYDKELFMGHMGGIERSYDISDLDYFTNEYTKAWEILFDLTYQHERVLSVEEENREIKQTLQDVSTVLEKFYLSLVDPKGETHLTKDDLEKALKRIRELK